MRYNSALMKKLMVGLVTLAFLAFPKAILAEGEKTVCTQYYGGGVVCGVHTPVDTALGGVNLYIYALAFLSASSILYLISRSLIQKYKGGENK